LFHQLYTNYPFCHGGMRLNGAPVNLFNALQARHLQPGCLVSTRKPPVHGQKMKRKKFPPHAKKPCALRFPQGECAEATIDNEGEWQFCADNDICVLERRKRNPLTKGGFGCQFG
jgi:hypothetical protein